MQRKPTKQSRGPNVAEKRFMSWVKQQSCCVCGQPGPSIADHMYGSTAKAKINLVTEHIGHWALLPYCELCDSTKTQGSHKKHMRIYGKTQGQIYRIFIKGSPFQPPPGYVKAIATRGIS